MLKRLCCLGILLFSFNIADAKVNSTLSDLNTNSKNGIQQLVKQQTRFDHVKILMVKAARRWDVDPAFLMAVAHIESRKGNQEFRTGLMGKTYYGPMGIHRDFLRKWQIDDLAINIEVGARALRGVGNSPQLQKKRLMRYNASFNNSYWLAIKSAEKKFSCYIKNNGL